MPESPAGDLRRRIGFWGGVAIVVGTTIGSGIFRKPGSIAALVPDPLVILALWAVFGGIILCGALTLGELSSLLPRTGGIYVYLRAAYGDAAAFVFGWLYLLVTVPAAIGALATFFGELVAEASGLPSESVPAIAIATIAMLTAANIRGVSFGTLLQGVFTVVKVVALVAIVVGALAWGRGDFSHLSGGTMRLDAEGVGGLTLAVSAFLWSYSGWQAMSMVAGEVEAPERRLGRILAVGTVAIVALYVGANLAYAYVLPLESIRGERLVAARVAEAIGGPGGAAALGVGMMVSVVGALNGQFLAKTRVPFALARDGLTFAVLGRCHARWSTPYVAIGVPGAVAVALVLWLRDFDALTTYFAVAEWCALVFAVAAVFVLRRRMPEAPRPFRVPLYPWVPLVFVVGGGASLAAILWAEGRRGQWSPHLGLGIAALGFPIYLAWRRLSRSAPEVPTPPLPEPSRR